MRTVEMDRWARKHSAGLPEQVAKWRAGHPEGTLRDAVEDLELWPKNPGDRDVQWHVWIALKELGDPAAREGFPAMRAAGKLAEQQRKIQHLTALAGAIGGRAGTVLKTDAEAPTLIVAGGGRSPRTVVCSRGEGSMWEFRWIWGSLIGPAGDVGAAAIAIVDMHGPAETVSDRPGVQLCR